MVIWHESARSPWPHPQQGSPARPAGEEQPDAELDENQALHDADELAGHAEAALAPGEAKPEHSTSEQLLADEQVVEEILAEGLYGPRHRNLEERLIRYTVPVLRHLLRDGAIFAKARRLRRPPGGSYAWLDFTDADREELAHEMVARAMPVFTAAVFGERRWKAQGGASLRTYFVNGCVMQFSQIYREWLQERAVIPAGLDLTDLKIDPVGSTRVPQMVDAVIIHDDAMRMLRQIDDPQVVEALLLRGLGYRAEDAAREVGLTPKAAESRLGRIRKTLAENGGEGPSARQHDTNPGGRCEE